MRGSYPDKLFSDKQHPIVWTIAGSDSGGGAGIQADLATIRDLGCHACSVVTTLTAQSSLAVTLVEPVSDEMLLAQLSTLLVDLPPKAIKMGLLANQRQLTLLAAWLTEFKSQFPAVPIIVDPVMVASCGAELGDGSVAASCLDFSVFRGVIDLITPNVLELGRLSQTSHVSKTQFVAAAQSLAEMLDCSVLAKGGDIFVNDGSTTQAALWDAQLAQDLLICRRVKGCSPLHTNGQFWLSSPRINTIHNHGSGCTLSSSIAAILALGFGLQDAVVIGKAYVSQGLKGAFGLGKGPGPLARMGWPRELALFPVVHQTLAVPTKPLPTKALAKGIGIYPVVDSINMLEALLASGVNRIQLRIKTAASGLTETQYRGLEAQIKTAIALGKHYDAELFINDHWQLAIKHGAFGVHLGQEDLAIADIAAIQRAGLALGISSHGYFEILLAHQYAPSYIALGHIFPTTTKIMPSAPQGLFRLKHYVDLLDAHYPLVAIGGIDLANVVVVKATGVESIAVVRAITLATDPGMAFRELTQAWGQC